MKRTKKVITTKREEGKIDVVFRLIANIWGKQYNKGVHSLSKKEFEKVKATRNRWKDFYLLISK